MKCNQARVSVLLLALSAALVAPAAAAGGLQKLTPADSSRLVSVDEEVKKQTLEKQPAECELIKERYADGQIKVERQVIRDLANHYINHGSWKKFDAAGNLVIEGQYRDGLRHGVWNAWYRAREAALFQQQPFAQFEGPFISQAAFVDGKLDGAWTIYDRKQRKITQWQYSAGQRHGQWQWWLPSGKKMQQMTYKSGVTHGMLKQYDAAGNVVAKVRLDDGRRLHEETKLFNSGQVKSKISYLMARRVPVADDDWASLRLADYKTEGEDVKHGPSETWYANGQPRQRSQFDRGIETGECTWWHKNGQLAIEGKHAEGKREGVWTWWHENGQKSVEGQFAAGEAVDRWVYWAEDGKVLRETSLNPPGGGIVRSRKSEDKTAARPDGDLRSSRRKSTWR